MSLYVNDAARIRDIPGVIQVFQDEGLISAVIQDRDWRAAPGLWPAC